MKQSALYSKFWYAYVLIYIGIITLEEILPVRNFLQNELPFLYTLVGVLGVLLLIWDFLSRRCMFQMQGTDILVLFFIASVISILVNYQYDLMGNLKCLMWMVIQVFVLGALGTEMAKEIRVQRLCGIFDLFIALWLVGVMWGLGQYIAQFGGTMETIRADRVQNLRIGFTESRLYGMFEDPNYAATASLFAIGFAVFCMCWGKRPKGFRVYYVFTILMQVCYVILSGSRAALLAALVVAFFGGAFVAAAKIERNVFFKAVSFLLAGTLSAALLLGGYKAVQKGLSYVPSLVEIASHSETVVEEKSAPDEATSAEEATPSKVTAPEEAVPAEEKSNELTAVDFTREDVANKSDFSNNRFAIWADYWKVFRTTPLFGASPRGYFSYIKDHFEDLYILQKKYVNVHNAYLALFVWVGVVGGGLMIFWMVRIIGLILGYLIRRWDRRDDTYWMVFLLTLLVLMMGVVVCTVQGIFFCNLITDLLFWLVLGIVLYLIRESEPERTQKKSLTAKLCDRVAAKLHWAGKQA